MNQVSCIRIFRLDIVNRACATESLFRALEESCKPSTQVNTYLGAGAASHLEEESKIAELRMPKSGMVKTVTKHLQRSALGSQYHGLFEPVSDGNGHSHSSHHNMAPRLCQAMHNLLCKPANFLSLRFHWILILSREKIMLHFDPMSLRRI